MIHPDIESVLIGEDEIKERVAAVAAEIRGGMGQTNPMLIGVLKGSFVFMADLARALDMDCEIDFMGMSSYGAGIESSGKGIITRDASLNVEGRDVIVAEDILDSGNTLSRIMAVLKTRKPRSLKLCVLLDKPSRRTAEIEADYVGFTVPDAFIVGYGLDYAERYRCLPYIGILKQDIYS